MINKGIQIIALLFMMVAKAIILSHAFIPHHHYDGLPVAIISIHHKHDHHHHHEHDCNSHDYHHGKHAHHACQCFEQNCQEHGHADDCQLFTDIYFRFCNCNHVFSSCDCGNHLSHNFLTLFSDYSTPLIFSDIGLPFRQNPMFLSCFSEYISQSLGLRAPPFC